MGELAHHCGLGRQDAAVKPIRDEGVYIDDDDVLKTTSRRCSDNIKCSSINNETIQKASKTKYISLIIVMLKMAMKKRIISSSSSSSTPSSSSSSIIEL